jgi:7-carboxy-7-deazaguanine synthase
MTINTQPIEKQQLSTDGTVQVHSIFYTIQGEGPFTGYPALFVRLAGCNLQCPGCDTEYTSNRGSMSPSEVLTAIGAHRYATKERSVVVITGGEPFRQNIAPLVRTLVSKGYRVQIETNGTLHVEDMPWDSITIVCSPKAGKIHPRLLPHIDAYKYVLHKDSVDKTDGLPIKALFHGAAPRVARPPAGNTKPVYLQPMDCKNEAENHLNMCAVTESCLRYGYILQLQVHKIINME